MTSLSLVLALFLLANLLVALLRVVRGPTAADRMLAALLLSSIGAGTLLLLANAGNEHLIDTALICALLAVISGATFAQRAWRYTGAASARENDERNNT